MIWKGPSATVVVAGKIKAVIARSAKSGMPKRRAAFSHQDNKSKSAPATLVLVLLVLVVLLVAVADGTDFDPKKGFGRAWQTHNRQITQSSAQSGCFCRRVQRSASPKDKKSTVSAFLEWYILQGMVLSTRHGKAEKRVKWVPKLPISMLQFQEPTVRATVRGKTGNPRFP